MIEVQDIVKDFKLTRKIRKEMGTEFKNKKSLRAVDKISFTCQPGKVFALVGPNGAGKTTILRMIATMLSQLRVRLKWEDMIVKKIRRKYGKRSVL